MNAERLHVIARALRDEIDETKYVAIVEQIASRLRQQVQEPQQPAHQEAVSAARVQMNEVLRMAPSNDFSPAWRQTLDELGVSNLIGDRLVEQVENILLTNEITPAAAADQIAAIVERLHNLDNALDQVLDGFAFFEIDEESLAPGEFEVGFLIPREAVENEFAKLGSEFVKLEKTLRPLLELGTGSRPQIQVRTISSSGFQVFLMSSPGMAYVLAKTIESLVTSYEKIVTIRRSHDELADQEIPPELLEQLAAHAEGRMRAEVEQLADDLLAELRAGDEARANELRKELVGSLNALANRLDRGYGIEVRVGELPDEGAEDVAEEPSDEVRRAAEAIASRREKLAFMNLTGRPILALPEGPALPEDAGESSS